MSDDRPFEIKIISQTEETIPLQSPQLERGSHRAWGTPQQDAVRVILGQAAYRQVNQHASAHPDREVGGILLGRGCRHEGVTYAEIIAALPAPQTVSGPASLTFTEDTWAALSRQQEERFPQLRTVGWYHSHPRMDVFFSGADLFIHENFFRAPWQVALVVEPHRHYGGFFVWRDGAVRPAGGFYERFDQERKSIVTWGNLPAAGLRSRGSPRLRVSPLVLLTVLLTFVLAWLILFSLLTQGNIGQLRGDLARIETTVQAVGQKLEANHTEVARGATGAAEGDRLAIGLATSDALVERTAIAEQTQAALGTIAAESTQTAAAATATMQALQEQQASATATAITYAGLVAQTVRSTGLAARQNGQLLEIGNRVQPGSPVEFSFTLQNTGAITLSLAQAGLRVLGGEGEQWVPAAPGIAFSLASFAGQPFTITHTFTDTGTYTVSAVVRVTDQSLWTEVLSPEGQPEYLYLTIP